MADELPECPLCMEAFELDDLNFYPCTCGYQICRFCWHRIRTNENGLCPACRKSYPEDPAQFKPLTDDEVHQIKKDRRQKETQRKQKSAESRKHLTNVRVIQKNLVFVVGLSQRLTDPEILKRHEYFGKFGKIHKVVINQSTSYVGSQGPSASAYVTYVRPEDAVHAIKVVNNLQVDGRTIKASLGTTKYCSHFLKGTQCLKTDCMYLHDYGDESASFTKEEIQQGKQLQYEQKLYEQYYNSEGFSSSELHVKTTPKAKDLSPPSSGQLSPEGQQIELPSESPTVECTLSETPPSSDELEIPTAAIAPATSLESTCNSLPPLQTSGSTIATTISSSAFNHSSLNGLVIASGSYTNNSSSAAALRTSLFSSQSDHLSLFSDSGYPSGRSMMPIQPKTIDENITAPHPPPTTSSISDSISVSSTTNWQEAFGFSNGQDDDLGFDPWDESSRGLADMIEKEKHTNSHRPHAAQFPTMNGMLPRSMFATPMHQKIPGYNTGYNMPPHNGYPNPAHFLSMSDMVPQRSKMLNLMQADPTANRNNNPYNSHNHLFNLNRPNGPPSFPVRNSPQANNVFNMQEWQEGLKALLPNINISFGPQRAGMAGYPMPPAAGAAAEGSTSNGSVPLRVFQPHINDRNWPTSSVLSHSMPDLTWDPAIINTGGIAASENTNEETPHWMVSLHHLTEEQNLTTQPVQQATQPRSMSWMPQLQQARFPPPGFSISPSQSNLDAPNGL